MATNAPGFQIIQEVIKNANLGNAEAQHYLGIIFYYGTADVNKDVKQAFEWFQKAAQQDHASAQCSLGYMFQNGDGVDKNAKEACEWFKKAAEQGYAQAQYNLGHMSKNGSGTDKNAKQACEWFKKAAEQGYAQAQYNLGIMFENGIGVDKDAKKACEWYQKAAQQGDASAQCSLGYMFQTGNGVDKDVEQAFEWYQKAAQQNHASAQYHLGYLVKNGIGVDKDETLAFAWYQKAAKQGHASSQYILGYLFRNGIGVDKDENQACEWYQKAATSGFVSNTGERPLFWAARLGLPECIPLLLEKNKDLIKDTNADSENALMVSLKNNKFPCAITLLENGADVNTKDKTAKTPLHYLVENDALNNFIPFFVGKGADLAAQNSDNLTPLQLAESKNKAETVLLLKITQMISPFIRPEHFQTLANFIEAQYLKKFPKDHLLSENRKTLEELIDTKTKEAKEVFFKYFSDKLEAAAKAVAISMETLESIFSTFLPVCLRECYLYPRQAEIFWKPYIDLLVLEDDKRKGELIFKEPLPSVLTGIMAEYYKGTYSPIMDFSKSMTSPFCQSMAMSCSTNLIQNRLLWLSSSLKDKKLSLAEQNELLTHPEIPSRAQLPRE